MFNYLYILSYTYKHIFIIFKGCEHIITNASDPIRTPRLSKLSKKKKTKSYSHILMYDNNIKIKSYVSIIKCNKDNKKLSCIM